MPLTSYLKIEGKTQGEMKGDCPQGGDKKDRILVYSVNHTVDIPADVHTGLASGQRIHHPYAIIKKLDQATPKIAKALCTGEQSTVTHDFYRIMADGTEQKYFTVKLEDAIVVSKRAFSPMTFLPESKPYGDMEEISFTYSKITWTYNDGNIEFTDDWKK